MTLYEIFWQPEIRKYKAGLCSKAAVFQLLCLLATFLGPLFIVYRSHGFWITEATYREQPRNEYKYQAILLLQTSSGQRGWSTISNLNALLQSTNLLYPSVRVREVDNNLDGKYDWMLMELDVPLPDTVSVYSVKLLLFFNYGIVRMPYLFMESMAVIDYTSSVPGASMSVIGDLNFKQKKPLVYKGVDFRLTAPIVDSGSLQAADYELTNIVAKYQQRNVSTSYENTLYSWEPGRPAGQPFRINATVYYTTPVIVYKPGFWQVLKWAWAQYASLLFVFAFVLDRVKTFVFENQLVQTVVQRPQLDCRCKSL